MSQTANNVAVLYLRGPFRIELKDGTDVTPTSVKAQALLAMLASSPRGSQSREWLKQKLWSTRETKQAAGSLRQCLLQIRLSLGAAADVVSANRQNVYLALDRVKIVTPPPGVFLDGIPVCDAAFGAWLGEQRQFAQRSAGHMLIDQPQVPQRKTIALIVDAPNEPLMAWFMQTVADTVSRILNETFSVDVCVSTGGSNLRAHWQIRMSSLVFEQSQLRLRMSLDCSESSSRIWAHEIIVPVRGTPPTEHPRVHRICNQLIEAIGDELFIRGDHKQSADRDCRLAIRTLFKMQPSAAAKADALFASAFDTHKRGLYLAWRAQCLTIIKAERYSSDPEALTNQAEALCAQALELEPNNSIVVATVANTQGQLFRNHLASYSLAKRAVQLNPSNPMAWWALSSASVYTGDAEASLRHAVRASHLVTTLPNKFWWDNQLFGAALMTGKLKLALAYAEECHAQNPNFRPPLRYLVALYSNFGREKEVERAIASLQKLEPDFSVDRLVNDQVYPASLIQRAPRLDLNKIRAFV